MNTEYLDYEIMQLTEWNEENLLHEKGKEKLTEFKAIKQALNIHVVTTRFSYKCTKCGSKYTELKKPLNYSDCQAYKGRNPNPILCGGRLISTN